MELKWLEDVLILLEEGNFSKAAERRNVTQPAFSRRIKNLENWLGAKIVDRSSQPITILQSAWHIEPEVRALAKRMKELKARFRSASQNRRQVEFAAQHSLAVSIFPPIMRIITDAFPDTAFRLHSANFSECLTLCLAGDVDLMLSYEQPKQKPQLPDAVFSKVLWGTDRLIPVIGGGLKYQVGVDQNLPDNIPFLAYPEDSFLGEVLGRSALPTLLNDHNVQWMCQAAFIPSIREMCLNGLGLAWLPASLIWRDMEMGNLISLASTLECCDLDTVVYTRKSDPFATEINSLLSSKRMRL